MDLTIRYLRACKYSINTDKGELQRNKLFLLGIASWCPGTQRRTYYVYKKEVDATSKKRESPLSVYNHTEYTQIANYRGERNQ